MVALIDLWLPILLSAVFVFVVSSVIHMLIPIHKNDHKKLPDEGAVLDALRKHRIPPGSYMFPMCGSMKDMASPEMLAKYEQGPVGQLVVHPTGAPAIGPALLQWFLFSIFIGVFVAYITGRGLARGTNFSDVFQLAGSTAILGYAFGDVCQSIWKAQSWSVTAKFIFDGVLYGLATGATFAWLWPKDLI